MKKIGYALAFLVFSLSIHAEKLPPGNYQMGGYGFMNLESANAQGMQAFNINAMGANGHDCTLNGNIQNNIAILHTDVNKSKSCVVSFQLLKTQQIEITILKQNGNDCHSFCGVRAGFDGVYEIPPKTCTPTQIRETRKLFLRSYGLQNYSASLKILEPLYHSCEKWMNFDEIIDLENDLAITYFHLHRNKDCIRILKTFTENGIAKKAKEDDPLDIDVLETMVGTQPVYFDWARSAIKSARHNLHVCGYNFKN
jgi:hypothetical protein